MFFHRYIIVLLLVSLSACGVTTPTSNTTTKFGKGEVGRSHSSASHQNMETVARTDEDALEKMSEHIEAHIGPIETVFHEIVSEIVHIDVHLVIATDQNPYHYLITSGMSDLPMLVPAEFDAPKYVELVMVLPRDWQLNQDSFQEQKWYWPIGLIKSLARFPHAYETWFGIGHTIPNGNPAQAYHSATELNGAILLPPLSFPDGFDFVKVDDEKEIHFYAVVPLYEEEMNYKLEYGAGQLFEKLINHSIDDVVNPRRVNVIASP